MKTWIAILLAAAMLPLCGCLDMPSVHPLYSDQTLVTEPRLAGAWQTRNGKENMIVRLTDAREYRLVYIDDREETTLYDLRLVKLGETLVGDIALAKDAGIPAHHFVALSLEGEGLRVWFLDSEALREKAAKEGLGYAPGKKNELVLTAATPAITAFLEKNLADELKNAPDEEFLPLK